MIASARPNARKSVSGSGRSMRNGRTINRVTGRVGVMAPVSPSTSADAQVLHHRGGRLIPLVRLFRERAVHDAIERRHRRTARQHGRLVVHDGVEHLDGRVTRERRLADEHLVEHHAGREQIRARVAGFAAELLGGRVLRRPDDHAERRHAHTRFVRGSFNRGGQAEVEQLDAVRGHEDVRRLQIAMDEPLAVQRVEAVQEPDRRRDRFAERHAPARDPCRERLPLQQLHREVELACFFADLVQLTDRGVVDAGGGARLAPQAIARRGLGHRRLDHLDRHRAAQAVVVG